MKATPTQRSMKYLRDRGFIVAKVEQRLPIPGMFVTKDAFGFGDLLAAKHSVNGAILVQTTAAPHFNHRVNKIMGIPQDVDDEEKVEEYRGIREAAIVWLRAGNAIVVHEWRKRGPRGERKLWHLRVGMMEWRQRSQILRVVEVSNGPV